MAIRYVDDLYPRANPRDGARILRFTHQQEAEYSHVRNGTGAGKILLRGTTSDAQAIDPLGLQYVRKVRVNTAVVDGTTLSGFDELVVGGYWFEQGDFLALDRKMRKQLSFGGAGTLSYLDREILWSHSYLSEIDPSYGTMDPFDDMWRLWNQGDWAGGDFLGAILWRVVSEGLAYRTGATYTHRHPDGLTYTDAHDDDKLQTAIPFVTLGFDQFEDSSGNPWTVGSGEFDAMVGESLYEVTKRLMAAGLYVEMDPDTFELRAWEVANHGRDRTGLAWGADVVRFNPPPSPSTDRTDGNILNDLKRALRPLIRATGLLAGGQDTYALATAAGDVPWHRHHASDVANVDALGAVADRQLGARNDAGDTVLVRAKVGNNPADGYYLPGEHAQTDDLATVHSGTGTWDWDESSYPIAKWSVTSRRTGAPDVFYHLGASYHSSGDRRFEGGAGVGRHTHPPNPRLCDIGAGPIQVDDSWKVLNIIGDDPPERWTEIGFDDSDWDDVVVADASPYVMDMGSYSFAAGARVPSDEIVLRREYWIDPDELAGADVTLRYALDNAGTIYVNGVALVTLGPDFTNTAGHYTGDHSTTIPRSTFRAGFNCVAIYVNNDSTGSSGAIPPGSTAAGLFIDITANLGNGISKYAARCDHPHHAGHIEENTYGNVQAAFDAILAGPGGGASAATEPYRHLTHGLFLYVVHRDSDNDPYLLGSLDGLTFEDLTGDRLFTPDTGDTNGRDPSIIHWDGAWWLVHTGSSAGITSFSLYSSADLETWGKVGTVSMAAAKGGAASAAWAPHWFIDPATGDPHVYIAVGSGGAFPTNFDIYEVHPTNRAMTSWSSPVEVTGTGFEATVIDPDMVYAPEIGTAGKPYKLFWKSDVAGDANRWIGYSESDSLTSGFAVVETGDWAGWKDTASIEAPSMARLDDGRWRMYFNENDGLGSIGVFYSDSTDGWATWTARASVTTPYLVGHGSVLRLPGVLDHEQDEQAHRALFDAIADAPQSFDDLIDVTITDAQAGEMPRWNGSAWVNDSGLICVDPGSIVVDDGTPFGVTLTTSWGMDGDTPYYDDAGAAAGDEAALFYDPLNDRYTLITYDF